MKESERDSQAAAALEECAYVTASHLIHEGPRAGPLLCLALGVIKVILQNSETAAAAAAEAADEAEAEAQTVNQNRAQGLH